MAERGTPPVRRFEDRWRRVEEQIDAGRIEPEQARWTMLAETLKAQHAREAWLHQGAPHRRAADRVF